MVQLLLILILLAIMGLFFFSVRLFFYMKEISLKLEELEAELVKLDKKISETADQLTRNESEIKFLQNQYKTFIRALEEQER